MATEQMMRASDADREQAVEALRGQYAEGRLTLDEFDERTSSAYAAKTWTDLRALTRDLPVSLGFGSAAAVAPVSGAPVSVASRAWPFAPLLPILVIATVAVNMAVWHHARGDFPFFPVIPLTIFASVIALRGLRSRQWRRPG